MSERVQNQGMTSPVVQEHATSQVLWRRCGCGHATLERPVIYYAQDRRDLTVLIHEGLHAYAHPNFTTRVRNYVNEGATEYLTRKLATEIGASSDSGYSENVTKVQDLVSFVGEDASQTVFFRGNFDPANRVLGPCGIERWAQLLQMDGDSAANEVLHYRNRNYCQQVTTFSTGLETTHGDPDSE